MSNVNLIIIKDDKMYFISDHFSKIKKLTGRLKSKSFLDAGYIILDYNNNVILNSQSAFDVNGLKKDFEVYDIK